jgi:hypothetical protein
MSIWLYLSRIHVIISSTPFICLFCLVCLWSTLSGSALRCWIGNCFIFQIQVQSQKWCWTSGLTSVPGILGKLNRIEEPLVLLISKASTHCQVSWQRIAGFVGWLFQSKNCTALVLTLIHIFIIHCLHVVSFSFLDFKFLGSYFLLPSFHVE